MGKSGGGGGQPTQTSSTSNVSNIPEYARPYVETMLGATQKQLFNMDDSGNITGFSPYKAYGATYDANGNQTSYDPSKAIAGFSPMQQQAQQGISNMQLPGTYAAGAGMTGMAGLNAMGAGQNLQNTLTNPGAMQQYMNPYIQNALQPQLEEMQRQYGITGTQEMSNATKAGAFGSNREALMASENERNKNMAMNQAIGQGYNTAFNNAQQQAGNVANLGLQGYQAAGQAGSALANIGGQALQAQQGIYGMQNQMGKEQQGQQQQIINQSMQDYANAQQYPLMQLGVMSNMLRGLPMQASTTNQYVAAPNQVTQGIGLAGAGASIYNALKKEGGVIKEKKMASGGIAGYNIGGSIKHDLYDMEPEEIQDYIKESASPKAKQIAQEVLRDKIGKAGGGIIAFADRGLVEDVPEVSKGQSLLANYEQEVADKSKAKFNFGEPKKVMPASVRVAEAPVERADPEMVRKAQIEAAQMQAKNSGYVPPTATKPAARTAAPMEPSNPMGEVNIPDTGTLSGIKNAIVNQYKRDTAGSPEFLLANKQITQEEYNKLANPKSVVAAAPAAVPVTNPNANLPPAPTNVKVDNLGRANAANQGPTASPVAPPVTQPGIKGAAPAVNPAGLPSGLEAPVNPEANKSIADLIAEKEAYMGPNAGNQQARAAAMAEKANAKDESRRMTSLRMAEFFGAWGSTPGNTIVAGLNALKNKVPDFITDMKEEAKVRRSIDKDIAELDKIERLEKAGNWEEAAKRKAELSKEAINVWGKKVEYAVHHEANMVHQAVGMARAGEGGSGGVAKNLNQATMRYQTENKNIATEKKNDDEYKMAKRTLSIPSKANDPKALEIVKNKEAAWDNRLAALKEDVDYYRQKQNRENGESTVPSDKKGAPGTAGNPIPLK
jgi:hypothetical protein